MAALSSAFGAMLLFADQQAIRNVARGMHNRQEFDISGLTGALMLIALFFLGLWGGARLFAKPATRTSQNSAATLFRELCREHRLTRFDGWLLARLARYHRLTDRSLLFLDPQWLDPAQCGPVWRRHAAKLEELRLHLFAGLASPLHL